jgi:hypothetical protein
MRGVYYYKRKYSTYTLFWYSSKIFYYLLDLLDARSIKEFSTIPVTGTITTNQAKYKNVEI